MARGTKAKITARQRAARRKNIAIARKAKSRISTRTAAAKARMLKGTYETKHAYWGFSKSLGKVVAIPK